MKENKPLPQFSGIGKTSEEIMAEARENERLQRLAEMIGAPRIPKWNDEEALDYLYGLEQNIYEMGIGEDTGEDKIEMYAEDSINMRVDNDEGTDYNREMAFVQLGLSGGYFLEEGSAYGVTQPMKDFRNINDAITFTLFAFSKSALRRFGIAQTSKDLYSMGGYL